MPTERVVEIPWALQQLPHRGRILDVGSCGARYLAAILDVHRELHCLDPRDCRDELPASAVFHHGGIVDCPLRPGSYDAVLMLSVIEHVGLPCYGQQPFPHGDRLAVNEAAVLLRPGGRLVLTFPAGRSKLASWYRQYSPRDVAALLRGWRWTATWWGFHDGSYREIGADEVEGHDYRDRLDDDLGAGAVGGVVATLA